MCGESFTESQMRFDGYLGGENYSMNHTVPFCLFWGLTASIRNRFLCKGKVLVGDPAKKKENHFERHEYMIESLLGAIFP